MSMHTVRPPYPMPSAPATLIRRLNAAGFEAYAVGGCVRDALLGLTPGDWDITTSALPEQTKTVFADCRVIETGLQHGTVTVRYEHDNFEITTYRIDGEYTDSRHPDHILFTPNVSDDVKRRDFTVNALLWHPDDGVCDLVDGITDLNNRTLRCVGEPHTRFSEDALRILRALRFASVYGFAVEDATKRAAIQLADTLCAVSAERIRTELFKLLCGEYADGVLGEFEAVIRTILPETTVTVQTLQTLGRAPRDLVCRLTVLLQGTDPTTVLRRLKTDNATISAVRALAEAFPLPAHTDRVNLKKHLRVYSENTLQNAFLLHIAAGENADEWNAAAAALSALARERPCVSVGQLAVNGEQLLALGLQGREIGETLERLLTAVIEETCENETGALIDFVKNTDKKSNLK